MSSFRHLTLILLAGCAASFAQGLSVELAISPAGIPRDPTPQEVRFTATIGGPLPSSVSLVAIDTNGQTTATLGAMRDDGLAGDPTPNDRKYTLILQVPCEKVGTIRFKAIATLGAESIPAGGAFIISSTAEMSPDNEVWASNDGGMNAIMYPQGDTSITRVLIYRSASANGPWTTIIDGIVGPEDFVSRTWGKVFDHTPEATTSDWYYKAETKKADGENIGNYAPVFLPAYAENQRPLLLTGNPLQVTVQAEKSAPKSKKNEELLAGTCGAPWNHALVTDEDFTCTSCICAQEAQGQQRGVGCVD